MLIHGAPAHRYPACPPARLPTVSFPPPQGHNRHVYAVASGIIQLPRGNAISEGVTVFPVGQGWLGLALLCAGTAVADMPSYMTAGLEKSQVSRVECSRHSTGISVGTRTLRKAER